MPSANNSIFSVSILNFSTFFLFSFCFYCYSKRKRMKKIVFFFQFQSFTQYRVYWVSFGVFAFALILLYCFWSLHTNTQQPTHTYMHHCFRILLCVCFHAAFHFIFCFVFSFLFFFFVKNIRVHHTWYQ